MKNSYAENGSMHVTCECYGKPPKIDPYALKKRDTPSKKCECPYEAKVYVFKDPTKLKKGNEFLYFRPGAYIYEYPKFDHTCSCAIVEKVACAFDGDVLYRSQEQPSIGTSLVKDNSSEEAFWKYATILYKSDVPQDKAFQILLKLGLNLYFIFLIFNFDIFIAYFDAIICRVQRFDVSNR